MAPHRNEIVRSRPPSITHRTLPTHPSAATATERSRRADAVPGPATDDLESHVRRLVADRRQQGLATRVDEAAVLERIATLLAPPPEGRAGPGVQVIRVRPPA
jgi:hypothetical protein